MLTTTCEQYKHHLNDTNQQSHILVCLNELLYHNVWWQTLCARGAQTLQSKSVNVEDAANELIEMLCSMHPEEEEEEEPEKEQNVEEEEDKGQG